MAGKTAAARKPQAAKPFTSNVEAIPLEAWIPDPKNARTHSETQIGQIVASLKQWGWTMPALLDEDFRILAGHGRRRAAMKIYADGDTINTPDGTPLPAGAGLAIVARGWTAAQKRAYILADNEIANNAEWDHEILKGEFGFLRDNGFDLTLTGFDTGFINDVFSGLSDDGEEKRIGSLAERFGVPPFSVLNAREGWWQDRKRAWINLGIRSELGRGEVMGSLASARRAQKAAPGRSAMPAADYSKKQRGTGTGAAVDETEAWVTSSIFDPVVCELAYRWFCPPGGTVLDPFSGGSVRGIVAAKLGRRYVGVDLRREQIEANRVQGERICAGVDHPPTWWCGDSGKVLRHAKFIDAVPEADFVFSCPPYGDLEVYSENAADLSNMAHEAFVEAYRAIIAAAVDRLAEDRFACFVVGDFRDDKGFYRNFVSDTISAFEAAGARLYNEAILVTMIGSLPVRANKQFEAARKMGKTHQNILVFCKGDPKRATKAIGAVEFGEITQPDDTEAEPAGDNPDAEFGDPL